MYLILLQIPSIHEFNNTYYVNPDAHYTILTFEKSMFQGCQYKYFIFTFTEQKLSFTVTVLHAEDCLFVSIVYFNFFLGPNRLICGPNEIKWRDLVK